MVIVNQPCAFPVTLIDGIEIGVELVRFPRARTICIIQIMIADGGDEGDRRTGLFIEDIAVLEESLYAPSVEVYMVRIDNRVRPLTTSSTIVQTAHESLKGIVAMLEEPTVSEVSVLHFRHIEERVFVLIHSMKTTTVMGKNSRVQRLMVAMLIVAMMLFLIVFLERNLPTSHDIRFRHGLTIDHEVDRERVLRLGFEQLHIDLTRGSLVAVDDRRGTFADLDRTHPRTRDIFQTEILRQTSYGRGVLLNELHVRTAQTEQTDLFSSRSRIGISNIHRGVGLKGFAEVTTSCTAEFFCTDGLCIECRRTALEDSHFPFGNGHLVQDRFVNKDDGEGLTVENGDGIVMTTDERCHKAVRGFSRHEGEGAVQVRSNTYTGSRPIDIRTHQRLAVFIQHDTRYLCLQTGIRSYPNDYQEYYKSSHTIYSKNGCKITAFQ